MFEDLPTAAGAIRMLRWFWAASIVGQIAFAALVVAIVGPEEPDQERAQRFFYMAIGLLPMGVGVGYFLRSQCYKQHWVRCAITPRGYRKGNLALLAAIEAVSVVTLIGAMITGDMWRPLLIVAVAIMVGALNFPTGRPMEPASPRIREAQ